MTTEAYVVLWVLYVALWVIAASFGVIQLAALVRDYRERHQHNYEDGR